MTIDTMLIDVSPHAGEYASRDYNLALIIPGHRHASRHANEFLRVVQARTEGRSPQGRLLNYSFFPSARPEHFGIFFELAAVNHDWVGPVPYKIGWRVDLVTIDGRELHYEGTPHVVAKRQYPPFWTCTVSVGATPVLRMGQNYSRYLQERLG